MQSRIFGNEIERAAGDTCEQKRKLVPQVVGKHAFACHEQDAGIGKHKTVKEYFRRIKPVADENFGGDESRSPNGYRDDGKNVIPEIS